MTNNYLSPENDQILVPVQSDTYRAYPLLNLLGMTARKLRSTSGFGLSPLHFITQRGPQQHGETPIDMRYDSKTIQILMSRDLFDRTDYWEERNELLDLLRPNRSFGQTLVRPLVYRKWFPGGKVMAGSDMSVTNGSQVVTSATGRFIHFGGLRGGEGITIGGVNYVVESVPNDFTLILTAAYAAGTATGVAWSYARSTAIRDLYVLLAQGPTFDQTSNPPANRPTGYLEALRFISHDPFWHGIEQTSEWALPDDVGDLVFDGNGAYFETLTGRWLFAPSSIGDTVSIIYWGTFRARPTVTINGPAIDPSVKNVTTGRSISVVATLLVGESIIIYTQALTVTRNDGTNMMPYTTGDIATFGLEPAPVAPDRVNDVQISFSGATLDSSAYLSWENLYVGI